MAWNFAKIPPVFWAEIDGAVGAAVRGAESPESHELVARLAGAAAASLAASRCPDDTDSLEIAALLVAWASREIAAAEKLLAPFAPV